jgi:hypothetical protein
MLELLPGCPFRSVSCMAVNQYRCPLLWPARAKAVGAGTKIEMLGCKPGGLCSKNILIVAVDWSGEDTPQNLSGLVY